MSPETPPPSLAAFLASNFGRKGEVAGWWRNQHGDVCVLVLYQEKPTVEFELSIFPEQVGSWGYDLGGYTLSLARLKETLARGGAPTGAEWAPLHPIVGRLQAFLVALERRLAPLRRLRSGTSVFLLDRDSFETDYLFLPKTLPLAAFKKLQALADDDDEEPIELEVKGELVVLPPAAGSVIWASCRRQCCRQQESSQATDTFFADLESQPPAWQSLAPAALPAWEALVGLGGVSGRCQPLPWWLEAARKTKDSFAGFLGPAEARLIRRHQSELAALFAGSRLAADAERFLELICAAAGADGYCLAWESGN